MFDFDSPFDPSRVATNGTGRSASFTLADVVQAVRLAEEIARPDFDVIVALPGGLRAIERAMPPGSSATQPLYGVPVYAATDLTHALILANDLTRNGKRVQMVYGPGDGQLPETLPMLPMLPPPELPRPEPFFTPVALRG